MFLSVSQWEQFECFGERHSNMLHVLNCSRFLDHALGHLPAPSGCFCTNFWRFRVPPSQSLEQKDHLVHSVRSQSASHAWALQLLVSDVEPHGFPPYFIAFFTSRNRCWTPPLSLPLAAAA